MKTGLMAAILATTVVGAVQAAPREVKGDSAAVLKLQALVKSLTGERDAAQAEAAKLSQEIDRLKKEKSAAQAAKDELSGALAAQRNAAGDAKQRLDRSQAALQDWQDKHRQLSQTQADLTKQLNVSRGKQQDVEQHLQECARRNVKLYQAASELLERYQNRGTLTALVGDEPLLQFDKVEMESLVQDYQDKFDAEKLNSDESQSGR
ncbi:hypothetical protein BJL95_23260 [Methylomonas sp. LWB]|nr:hypothetical protein BJL95_23260 [Methylomonas sp. LWB]